MSTPRKPPFAQSAPKWYASTESTAIAAQPVERGLVGEVRARRRGRRSGRRRGFDRFRRGGCHGINCVKTGLGGGYQRSTGNRRRRRCARPLEQCARYPLAGGDDRRGTGGRRARQRIASCEAPVVARSRNSGAPGVGHRRRGPAAADPGDDAEPRCADGRGLHARLPGSSPARSDPEPRLPPPLRSRQPVGAGGRLQGVWHRPVRGAVLRAVAAGGRGVRHVFDRPLVGPTCRGRVRGPRSGDHAPARPAHRVRMDGGGGARARRSRCRAPRACHARRAPGGRARGGQWDPVRGRVPCTASTS